MASKGKSPTLTNGDVAMPTTGSPYISRVDEEIRALWSMANQPRGVLVNGDHVVSQENGDVAQTGVAAGDDYATDQWYKSSAGAVVVTHQRVQSLSLPGFTNALRVQVTTIDNSLAAGDYLAVLQPVEGYRMAGLGFGTSGARRLLAAFWARSSVTGTYGFSIRNAANNRSYVKTFTINVANTWEFKVIEVDGDTTGTWVGHVNTLGLTVGICLSAGSSLQGTDATWNAANNLTTSAQTNMSATLNATFDFTGVQLIPADAASLFDVTNSHLQNRWPTMFRKYDEELVLCRRYFERQVNLVSGTYVATGQCYSTTAGGLVARHVSKRANPTLAVSSALHFSVWVATSGQIDLATLIMAGAGIDTSRVDFTTPSSPASLVAGNAAILFSNSASATLDFNSRM